MTLIENKKLVSVIKELLSTKEENVEKALLYRTVATGRDVIEKQHTTQEASYGRDALAKVGLQHLRIKPQRWCRCLRGGDISAQCLGHCDSHQLELLSVVTSDSG